MHKKSIRLGFIRASKHNAGDMTRFAFFNRDVLAGDWTVFLPIPPFVIILVDTLMKFRSIFFSFTNFTVCHCWLTLWWNSLLSVLQVNVLHYLLFFSQVAWTFYIISLQCALLHIMITQRLVWLFDL